MTGTDTNRVTIIIISSLCALAVACGVVAGILYYRGADRRAVERSFKTLSEDLSERSEELLSARELDHVIDEVMYGDAHIEMSVNVGGIDVSGLMPDGIAGMIAGSLIGNTGDVTIGADAVIDRMCKSERLSVTGDLSIMNFSLADIGIYATGDTAYLDLPEKADAMWEVDLSNLTPVIEDSDILTYACNELGFPRLKSVELFGGHEQKTIWAVMGDIRDQAESKKAIHDMWKHAEINRQDEKQTVASDDGREYECRVYDVKILQEDAQEVLDQNVTIETDAEFILYLDEYGEIRRIETTAPIMINGRETDLDTSLTGEELPIDEIDMDLKGDGEVNIHVLRDNRDYDVEVSSGEALAQGVITPKYDRDSSKLDVKYSKLSFIYRDEEIMRSSGRISVSVDPDDVKVADIPDRETTDSFDLFAADIVEHVLDDFGALIGLF